jgi:Uri superfamily endonuclease
MEYMKGFYVLIINLKYSICIRVGALGNLTFAVGMYAYVGSAQNSIELRVARHQRKDKRLFWHIDYLLNNEAAKIIGVYCTDEQKKKECQIATLIQKNCVEPIAGFGCSDCKCLSHFFRIKDFQFLEQHMQPL